jgi:hypothetical protein
VFCRESADADLFSVLRSFFAGLARGVSLVLVVAPHAMSWKALLIAAQKQFTGAVILSLEREYSFSLFFFRPKALL